MTRGIIPERHESKDGAKAMIASTFATRAADAYARIRVPANESTVTSGRATTAELAIKPSVGPDVLLRQLRSGRATAEVATATSPITPANQNPAATFTKAGQGEEGAAIAAAAAAPVMANQSIPGAARAMN
jgi:hypothetical protein